jgi:nucleoside diphosphate kinase
MEYPINEDWIREHTVLDSKNRPVCQVKLNDKTLQLYVGPDAHGFIHRDRYGEYIRVGNEKRRWRGILGGAPGGLVLEDFEEFGLCALKPDAFVRGLDGVIIDIIREKGLDIVQRKDIVLKEEELFRLYPYFFEKEWEFMLKRHFLSDSMSFMLIKGSSVTASLLALRKEIRSTYRIPEEHPVRNLFHCADFAEEALREALIFFSVDEIIDAVGSRRSYS